MTKFGPLDLEVMVLELDKVPYEWILNTRSDLFLTLQIGFMNIVRGSSLE